MGKVYLRAPTEAAFADALHARIRTGRPLGTDAFVAELERRLVRPLRPQKRGPRARLRDEDTPDPFSGNNGS